MTPEFGYVGRRRKRSFGSNLLHIYCVDDQVFARTIRAMCGLSATLGSETTQGTWTIAQSTTDGKRACMACKHIREMRLKSAQKAS